MIRPRKTLRRNEPTPAEKQDARVVCCDRALGLCEYCMAWTPVEWGHLHHEHGKRRYGWMESELQRHVWLCAKCHHDTHNPKSVPKK